MKKEKGKMTHVFTVVIALMMLLPVGSMMMVSGNTDSRIIYAQPEPTVPESAGVQDSTNTVIIQPNGTDGKDNFLWETRLGENYGAIDELWVGNWSDEKNLTTLIEFNLPSTTGTISGATLSLYCYYLDNKTSGVNVSVYPLSAMWTEGSGASYIIPSTSDSCWNNRTTNTPWNTPGGDYYTYPSSNMAVTHVDAWFSWDVTEIVKAWANGSMENNGFLLKGNSTGNTYNFAGFRSSDFSDSAFRPKLTLLYSVEIDPPVAPITTDEDTPVDIDLSGRGQGTVVHNATANNPSNAIPFFGGLWDECRYQVLYTPDEVGAEGKITRIAFDRASTGSANFSNVKISMAHTSLTDLTDTFDNNYVGYLTEVFKEPEVLLNSSDDDSWLYFDLNGNFTYDSSHNLLVDIQWVGDGGASVSLESRDGGSNNRRVYNGTATASTGSPSATYILAKFYVDTIKNGVLDSGTSNNYWPFSAVDDSMHMQALWHSSDIGESGRITKFYLQAAYTEETVTFTNLSIRMAHSANTSLGTVFEANHIDPWVEVINSSSYTVSTSGAPEWIEFDLNRPFDYNGNDNIVIDFRWQESAGTAPGIYIAINLSATYAGQMGTTDYSATTGSIAGNWAYNVRFEFANYPGFTWSATSSDISLFTVSIVNNTLHIDPVANAYGSGTVELTLHNGAYSTTQTIPVTINPVNDAPVISEAPESIVCVEDVPYELDMAPYISDVDDEMENLTISTDSSYATVNGTVITFLYPEGVTEENVTVTVSDLEGTSDSIWINVSVTLVNDPPYFVDYVDNITVDATVPYTYQLYPEDEETPDNLTISTDSSYATVNGTVITFLYPKGIGHQTVNIYLSDAEIYGETNNVTYVLDVTIIDHPEVSSVSVSGYSVVMVFDMPMNESTVSLSIIGSAEELSGNISWNADSTTLTFAADMAVQGNYTLTIPATATSVSGASMLEPYTETITFAYTDDDTDGDGMSDSWEAENGLDPNDASDGTADNDNDGLTNLQEYQENTDPNNDDTDGDGMPDQWELNNSLNPTVNDAEGDADGDGLTNIQEYQEGTDPQNSDTDGDGIPDGKDSQPLAPQSFVEQNMMLIGIIVLLVIVAVAVLLFMKKKKGGVQSEMQRPQEGYAQPYGEEMPPTQDYDGFPVEQETPEEMSQPSPEGERGNIGKELAESSEKETF